MTIDAPVLLKRKYKMPSLPPTPYKTTIEDIANIRLHQLSTLIQKIVRGRAIQCMVTTMENIYIFIYLFIFYLFYFFFFRCLKVAIDVEN